MIVNNTPYAVAEAVLIDPEGREVLVVAVKGTRSHRGPGPTGIVRTVPFRSGDVT